MDDMRKASDAPSRQQFGGTSVGVDARNYVIALLPEGLTIETCLALLDVQERPFERLKLIRRGDLSLRLSGAGRSLQQQRVQVAQIEQAVSLEDVAPLSEKQLKDARTVARKFYATADVEPPAGLADGEIKRRTKSLDRAAATAAKAELDPNVRNQHLATMYRERAAAVPDTDTADRYLRAATRYSQHGTPWWRLP
jgi:hypothetical protein